MAMYKSILILAALLALEAALVWRPFNSELIAYQSGSDDRKTAGQITEGFHLTQEVPAKLIETRAPKKPITHWWKSHRKLYTTYPNCFAIRFASYNRHNAGRLAVDYRQGNKNQRWSVEAADLANDFRRFCPSTGFTAGQPLQITVDGIDGRKGQSATMWLSKSRLKPAIVNGRTDGDRSLYLRLVYFRHMGPGEILRIDRGAFAFACLCSLAIALLVLVSVRKSLKRSI